MRGMLQVVYVLLGAVVLVFLTVVLNLTFGVRTQPPVAQQPVIAVTEAATLLPANTPLLDAYPPPSPLLATPTLLPIEVTLTLSDEPIPLPTLTPWPTYTPQSTPTIRPGPTETLIIPLPPAPDAAGTLLYLARPLDNPDAPFQVYTQEIDALGNALGVPSLVFRNEANFGVGGLLKAPNGQSVLIETGGVHIVFPHILDLATLTLRPVLSEPISGRLFGWHPDGRRILVWADVDIRLIDTVTGEYTVLTLMEQLGAPSGSVQGAAVSPNGQLVAFVAPESPSDSSDDMWLVSTKGGDARIVPTPEGYGVSYLFSWSPDSSHILLGGGSTEAGTAKDGTPEAATPNGPLWLLNIHDSSRRPLKGPFIYGWGFEPAWSPDGQWLAYPGYDEETSFGCAKDGSEPDWETCMFEGSVISIENIVTGELRQLARGIQPAWSPDGSMISFVSNTSGNPETWVVNIDGSDLRQVTATGQYQYFPPAWVTIGDIQ